MEVPETNNFIKRLFNILYNSCIPQLNKDITSIMQQLLYQYDVLQLRIKELKKASKNEPHKERVAKHFNLSDVVHPRIIVMINVDWALLAPLQPDSKEEIDEVHVE